MRNRMTLLSRRLGRFAGGFSFATIAFFSIGLYAAANNKGQLVYLVAGLVLVCLLASFFLWLAYGFAWALIPDKPAEATKPAEAIKPVEAMKPAEPIKPPEAMKPVEAIKPIEAIKPTEAIKPLEAMKTVEATKPVEALKPVEAMKPAEAMKPPEEKKPAEEKIAEEDPPDAKYTITGRRIY